MSTINVYKYTLAIKVKVKLVYTFNWFVLDNEKSNDSYADAAVLRPPFCHKNRQIQMQQVY